MDLATELRKLWKIKVTVIPIVIGHSNYSIVLISQNTETSPGDLRKLAVTQTPVEAYQIMWCEKLLKE